MPAALPRTALPLLGAALCAALAVVAGQGMDRVPGAASLIALAGAVVVAVCLLSSNYALTLTIFAVYLAVADGSLRLLTGEAWLTAVRDVLLYAIVAGALLRLTFSVGRVRLPPWTGFVVLLVALVLVQVFNPNQQRFVSSVAAIRQHVEFIPLFFLAFYVMRSQRRLRWFLGLLVVAAAVNGIVGFVQLRLTPDELAAWGPGYAERIRGSGLVTARVAYDEAGAEFVRPFALGSDLGFGGNVGLVAAPAVLALFLLAKTVSRRLALLPLAGCVVLAVATSQNRQAVIGTAVAVVAFAALASLGRRSLGTILSLIVGMAIAYGALSLLSAAVGEQAFRRYQDIGPSTVVTTTYDYRVDDLGEFASYLTRFPLGAGLGSGGPAVGFFGIADPRRLNSETELGYLVIELGIPGLILTIVLWIKVMALAPRLRRRLDPGERLALAAVAAPIFGLAANWLAGAVTATSPGAPYFWFAAGVLVFWLHPSMTGEPRRAVAATGPAPARPRPLPARPRQRPPAPAAAPPRRASVGDRMVVVAHSSVGRGRAHDLFGNLPGVEVVFAGPGAAGVRRALRAVAGRRALVYLVDTGMSTTVAAVAARLCGKRVVLDTGDLAFGLARSTGRRSFTSLFVVAVGERLALRAADHVVVRGRAHARYVRRPTTFAPDLAPRGTRPRDRETTRAVLGLSDAFVVGLVGSLVHAPRSGLSYGWDLVEALALTPEHVHGLIIGDGDAKPRLEARARELGVRQRCHFLGRIPPERVDAFVSAMDAGISTQTNDAVGSVRTTGKLPLYLACGCPVLASDVGEAHAVLGPLGWTVPYHGRVDRRYPARLAEAITAWAGDPEGGAARRRMALRVHADTYDADAVSAKVLAALEDVLARG